MKPNPNISLCFIGGSGRSGTTLLRRIFNNHPRAIGIPEFRITVDPGGLCDFYQSVTQLWSPYLFDERLKRLNETLHAARRSRRVSKYYHYFLRKTGFSNLPRKIEPRYTDINIEKFCENYSTLTDELIEELTSFRFKGYWTGRRLGSANELNFSEPEKADHLAAKLGDFYRRIAIDILFKAQATHFLDDNTWNILYFHIILKLLPNARLVHIYRDPRDVTASYMHQVWAPSDPVDAARYYSGIMQRWNAIKDKLPEESYYEIALEKLVENPETLLKNMCDFWNIAWDPSLMNIELNRSNTGRWKKDIPTKFHPQIESVLNPFLVQYGYREKE